MILWLPRWYDPAGPLSAERLAHLHDMLARHVDRGAAPGLAFETLDWLQAKQVAAIATDTWGVEVRPNQTDEATQPWHWIAIPIMGLTLGEIFYLAELASDCAEDKRYEFLFVAPALPITGAVASPINPLAIK